jgi:hypothetical protein
MSSTLYRNKNLRRPKKGTAEKARRIRTQKKRLLDLGVSEDLVAKMPPNKVRELLRRPEKTRTAFK